jgi:hypothetical protein
VSDLYGTLRHPGAIEQAALERLKAWMPAMVAEVERQEGREPGKLPRLRGYITVSELARWPEDQIPLAVVVSPGTLGDPMKDAEGYYRAIYSLAVAIVTSAATEPATRQIAQLYGAAVRACLLQRRSLENEVEVTDWTGESFDDLPVDERRTMFAGVNSFAVELGQIVSWQLGPAAPVEPPDDPLADPPGPVTATDVQALVEEKTE